MTTMSRKFCVTYRDLRDGKTYGRVETQHAGESYEAFFTRVCVAPFGDMPMADRTVMDLRTGVRRGLLPISVLA